MSDWISVKERLPEQYEEFIVTDIETYNGGWIPVSERLPEQYEEFIVTDIETSDTYQSRYIDEFPNIDELVYKEIIDKYRAESEDKE